MRVAPSASWYGLLMVSGTSIVATKVAGPVSVTRPGAGLVERHSRTAAVHVHDEFRRRRRRRGPSRPAAHAAAAAPVPQASVMPAPRSWTRIVMASRLGPGSTISRLTSGTLPAEGERGRRRRRRRRRRRCAGCRGRGGRRGGRGWRRWRPTRPARASSATAPMSTVARIVQRVLGRPQLDARAAPASVRIVCGVEVAAPGGQRLGEAADAVAAHLGPAAVGVVQHHPGGVAVGRARRRAARRRRRRVVRSHTPPGERGQVVDVGVERDEEVVAEAVVLGEVVSAGHVVQCVDHDRQPPRPPGRGRRRPSVREGRGGTTAPGGRRTGGCAATIEATASSSVDPPVEVLEQLLVAERLAGGPRHARRARTRSTSSSSPASIIAVDPPLDPLGERRARPAQPDQHRVASAGRPAGPGRTS